MSPSEAGTALPGLCRGAPGYERRRQEAVWQLIKPPRYPASIVEVTDPPAAAAALLAAQRAGRQVSVLSSGHSYIGHGLRDDRVLLDLRGLDAVEIDAAARTARVGPAVTNGALHARLHEVGLAFPVGHSPTVAVGGFLLGGGLGWNPDGWGVAACGSVTGATVLLASGDVVRTTEDVRPDLFFALRGAGPQLPGAVLEYELALQRSPRAITVLRCDYPVGATDALAAWAEGALPDKADAVELALVFSSGVLAPGPADRRDAGVSVTAVAFADTDDEAADLLDPTADTLPPGASAPPTRRRRPLADLLAENDTRPQRCAVEGIWTDAVGETLRACAGRLARSPSTADILIHVSLRSRELGAADLAFSMAGPTFVFSSVEWADEADDDTHLAWQDGLLDELGPWTRGFYVGETDFDRHPDHLRRCFSPSAWARIEDVRAAYDPLHLFTAAADRR